MTVPLRSMTRDALKINFGDAFQQNTVGDTLKSSSVDCLIKDSDRKSRILINSTDSGFKVQEFLSVKKIVPTNMDADYVQRSQEYKDNAREYGPDRARIMGYTLGSDMGENYVLKDQATINVDFSKSDNTLESEPSITIESKTISYGHSELKNKMDKRSFGQCIVDLFKRVFGLNKVKDISPLKEVSHGKNVNKEVEVSEGNKTRLESP